MDVVKHWPLVALVALPQLAWAGFVEGLAATQRGDLATALSEWLPHAEQGNADAQFKLKKRLWLIWTKGRPCTETVWESTLQ